MTLLLVKGDPKGYEEKEALEREVACLEPYLEALPSLGVLAYLARAYPEFLDSLGRASYYRPFIQTCFTMTLFLKSGPCFILPGTGLFGGILTWRFIASVTLNLIAFKIKWAEAQYYGETFIANAVCVSTLGVVLGLVSIHQAVGSWRNVFSLILNFPPLLLLPVFGFVTFGLAPEGKTQVNLEVRAWRAPRLLYRINCCCRRGFSDELEMDLGQLYCVPLDQQVEFFA